MAEPWWTLLSPGSVVDVVYTLEFNIWNGQTNLQLNLIDLQLSNAGDCNGSQR
jgi:hypothetical protein